MIRQLSKLAFYAEDIFSDILSESKKLNKKTEYLQTRINRLIDKVSNLDFQQEQVSFIDLNSNELFKSSFTYDQEVLSRQTMPNSLARKYNMCDEAPPLYKLDKFRDDGKDSIKFYTDPNYFFDLWKNEMLKKTEKEKFSNKMISNSSLNTTKQIEESHINKQIKKPRKPENTTEKYRKMMSQQEFFADSNLIQLENNQNNYQQKATDYSLYSTVEIPINRDPDNLKSSSQIDNQTKSATQHFRLNDSNSTKILQIAQQSSKDSTNHVRFNQTPEIIPNSPVLMKNDHINQLTENTTNIPPPPPMPGLNNPIGNSLNNNTNLNKNTTINGTAKVSNLSNVSNITNVQTTSLAQEILKKQQELRSAPSNPKPLPQFDARSSLLASIREGIKLRKVQQNQQKQVQKRNDDNLKDVASILARRVAMQLSDSESNHSNNESDDDWIDG